MKYLYQFATDDFIDENGNIHQRCRTWRLEYPMYCSLHHLHEGDHIYGSAVSYEEVESNFPTTELGIADIRNAICQLQLLEELRKLDQKVAEQGKLNQEPVKKRRIILE